MRPRDPAANLQDMLAHAREAMEMADERTRADLDSDRQFNLSLVRLLEILGEAAGRVSPDQRAKHAQIPWPAIIGMRNRLIHGYDNVDFDIVWEVVTRDLPPLARMLERLIRPAGGE